MTKNTPSPDLPAGIYYVVSETGQVFPTESQATDAITDEFWIINSQTLSKHPELTSLASTEDTTSILYAAQLNREQYSQLTELFGDPHIQYTSNIYLHTVPPWLITRQTSFYRQANCVNINHGSIDTIPADMLSKGHGFPELLECATAQQALDTANDWANRWSILEPQTPIYITTDTADLMGDVTTCYMNGRQLSENEWPDD